MDLSISFGKQSGPEAYEIVRAWLTPESLARFQVSAEIDHDEEGKRIEARGKGFVLILNFGDSEMEVSLELGLILRPLKKQILKTVERELSSLFSNLDGDG